MWEEWLLKLNVGCSAEQEHIWQGLLKQGVDENHLNMCCPMLRVWFPACGLPLEEKSRDTEVWPAWAS